MARTFPRGFCWGVATSGHQSEGGSTKSDTWFLEHVRPTVFREPSGKACNSYELWREDVDLVAALGLNAYRFSVEWAGVEPAEGQFSAKALAHYRAIVDYCLAVRIAPVVTFSHFTSPHWFALRGGWLDPQAPVVFARYCDLVTEQLGDGIAFAVTLNEPNLPRLLPWLDIPAAVHQLERAALLALRARRPVCLATGSPTSCSLRRWAPWPTAWPTATERPRRPSRPGVPSCRSASASRSSTTRWWVTMRQSGTASAPRCTPAGWR